MPSTEIGSRVGDQLRLAVRQSHRPRGEINWPEGELNLVADTGGGEALPPRGYCRCVPDPNST
jgi:hypothetical protein